MTNSVLITESDDQLITRYIELNLIIEHIYEATIKHSQQRKKREFYFEHLFREHSFLQFE